MANNKISLLPENTSPTLNDRIPIVNDGITKQISVSGFTEYISNFITASSGGGLVNTTYETLADNITFSGLTGGTFYRITDFQTCYDQPDYDYNSNPKTIGIYKTGPIEPIVVVATGPDSISEYAFQPTYPNDIIKYDWRYNATEVTNNQAYGRITERVDEYNNRTDYDHRNILFKRYKLFGYRTPLDGSITLDLGVVTGNGTDFTLLSVGDVIITPSITPSNYKIVEIIDQTNMVVTGETLGTYVTGLVFYQGFDEGNGLYMSIKESNIDGNEYVELTTFQHALETSEFVYNNYFADGCNVYNQYGTYLLPNNLFLIGRVDSNYIGYSSSNNTFSHSFSGNKIGDFFIGNTFTNDFIGNRLGDSCRNNLSDVNIINNVIDNDFSFNLLLGSNGANFEDNKIGSHFNSNKVYVNFTNNDINQFFENNILGDTTTIDSFSFDANKIGYDFVNNIIKQNFQNNVIETNFNNNRFSGYTTNNIIGKQFEYNTVFTDFDNNEIFNSFKGNQIESYFNGNQIGFASVGNHFIGLFNANSVEGFHMFNDYSGDTTSNVMGPNFFGNKFNTGLYGNSFGFSFGNNIIGLNCYNNNFAANCQSNVIGINCQSNSFGVNCFFNIIGDNFGYDNQFSKGNIIGNDFTNNHIGNNTYGNSIIDGFNSNIMGDGLKNNEIKTKIAEVNFTEFDGNIIEFGYSSIGTTATDGNYYNVSGTTNNSGIDGRFNIEILGGLLNTISLSNIGKYFNIGDLITILGSQIGGVDGSDDITITVDNATPKPSVYEDYNCEIYERLGGNKRLAYYDSDDLRITNEINL